MGININQGGKPVALVLLRSYEQSQLPSPNKRRRMPAQKRLVDMYPDWPDTDPADVRNEVHRRLVLLAKNVQMQAGKHGSIRYVAERSQVSYTMITRFVRGESIPRVDTIMAIEEFVKTSVWPVRETTAKPVDLPQGSWTR